MSSFDSTGTKLYYETHGEGNPLLIIPGGGADGRYYLPIVDILKDSFQVILPDPRGCGRSEKGSQSYTFDLLASDIAALLDHLKIETTHIMGHSMGGMVAQHFSCQHPSFIKKLILFATSNTLTEFAKHCCKTAAIAKDEASLKTFIHVMAIWNFSEPFFQDEKNVNNLLSGAEQDPYPLPTESLIDQMKIINDFDSSAQLKELKVPTLVLGCEKDIIFPTEQVKNLVSLIHHAKYQEIQAAAHSAHIEQPELVSEIIKDFLGIL